MIDFSRSESSTYFWKLICIICTSKLYFFKNFQYYTSVFRKKMFRYVPDETLQWIALKFAMVLESFLGRVAKLGVDSYRPFCLFIFNIFFCSWLITSIDLLHVATVFWKRSKDFKMKMSKIFKIPEPNTYLYQKLKSMFSSLYENIFYRKKLYLS